MNNETASTRREVLRGGARLVWVPPALSTFLASEVYAANYSCYPQGHACDPSGGPESCCAGLSCSGPGPETCKDFGGGGN